MEGEEIAPKSNVWAWVLVGVVIVAAGLAVWYFYFRTNSSKSTETEESQVVSGQVEPKEEYSAEYNWSKMSEGPYNDQVSFATSKDLLNWTDSDQVLAIHASVPDAIVKDGIIYTYFVDVSTDGYKEKIGLMKSSDSGKTWSQKVNATIKGLGTKTAVDPDPFLLPDGRIRLYYFDISTTKNDPHLQNNTIYSAISSDGVNFVEEEGYRLKYPAIFDSDVIKVVEGYRMYAGTNDQRVIYADSADGLTFNYQGVSLSGGAIPNVVIKDGKYYLFTGGVEISTSTDGKVFEKIGKRFQVLGSITADPGVIHLADGSYLMFYKTKVEH